MIGMSTLVRALTRAFFEARGWTRRRSSASSARRKMSWSYRLEDVLVDENGSPRVRPRFFCGRRGSIAS